MRHSSIRVNAGRAAGAVAAGALALGAISVAPTPAAASISTNAQPHPPQHRGTLLSITKVAALSPAQVETAVAPFFGNTRKIHYAITGYRITYSTIDPAGRPTTASGLVVLPTSAGSTLHVIAYEHGTNPTRDAVASITAGDGDREAVELFASAGFAAVAPDYLGLGTGPGTHPYMDLASEITASTDMLDASRQLAARTSITLDPRLLITGFSQGGQASMGLAHAIQTAHATTDEYWKLGAVAPISGPYDVQTAEIPAMLHNNLDPESAVLYISFWTVSMNRIYHLYDNPAEVFRQPYAATVDTLFDGSHSEQDILTALPPTPTALLTPQYLARLRHPTGALLTAMQQNDTSCAWHPNVPVRLYGATGDRDVALTNSQKCQRQLAAHGDQVPLIDVGNVDHNTSAELSVPQVLDFLTTHA